MRAAIIGRGTCVVPMEEVLPLGIDQLLICAEGGVLQEAEQFANRSGIPRLIWKEREEHERAPVDEMIAFVESAEYILFLYEKEDEQLRRAIARARELGRTVRVIPLDKKGRRRK